MTRPIYETPKHVSEEAKIMREIADRWGVTYEKTEQLDNKDYAIFNPWTGTHGGWVEIKRRYNDRLHYPTYMIAKTKIDAAVARGPLPTWLVVRWNDALGWVRIDAELPGMEIKTGGRYDRGDSLDVEPCAYFPIELFHGVRKKSAPTR